MALGYKKTILAVVATSFFSLAAVKSAEATLLISITVGGLNFCAADNNVVCTFGTQLTDVDAAAGRIELNPTNLAGVLVTGAAQQATFGPTNNILNSSYLQATNTTGATITGSAAVSATGFIPPVSSASVSGSATYQQAVGSSFTINW